ncbi:MAG: [FeFe] hydrogenase H-cluster maturation GTPase HydF [Muribaculaceae bacterium]|nr:[FeFe] hydrogenase H-cluster maturation GTPase HydF [Muribaculaceae bacterium]
MNNTPQSERLRIVVLGACNSGKSSLINMLADQEVSLTSDIAGTTTDPVKRAMELPHAGAVVLVDTAGLDDTSPLGKQRADLSLKALDNADLALLLTGENADVESECISMLKSKKIPFVKVANKSDIRQTTEADVHVCAAEGKGRPELIEAILQKIPSDFAPRDLLGNLVKHGDLVVLVMPQDSQAPKGRLILPQVQTIRALIDRGCTVVSATPETLPLTLSKLNVLPDLTITDSQVFDSVKRIIPSGVRLTSFSILMAAYKGDIEYFVEGAKKIAALDSDSRVLIAEACTHVPANEDIGRVKLPLLLRKKAGEGLSIDFATGKNFPDDPGRYDLIIHCGGCMFNRRMVMSRVQRAKEAGVAMTNYGVAIACLKGIIDKVVYPGN